MPTTVTVLLFAKSREIAKTSSLPIAFDHPANLEDLKTQLVTFFPKLFSVLSTCLYAINQEYVDGNPSLNDGDEIAIIPPVSGG